MGGVGKFSDFLDLSVNISKMVADTAKVTTIVTCALLSPVNSLFHVRGQTTVWTNYGDRSFAVHGPVVWNSLPADLRLLNISLPAFRKRLKMFLF